MYAKPEKVRARRAKRRLKAVASIAVALCAGAFLACVKKPEVDAGGSDANAPREPAPFDGAREAESADAAHDAGAAIIVTSADGSADAKPDALVKRAAGPRDAAVDVREHRKGMPVPDNLLE